MIKESRFELTTNPDQLKKAEKIEKIVRECLAKNKEFIWSLPENKVELHFNSLKEIENFVKCFYCKRSIGMCRQSCKPYCEHYLELEKLNVIK